MEKEELENYRKFQEGDLAAFEQVVKKYKSGLIYFLKGYVHKTEIAEDLAQDVFVYILLHPNGYHSSYSLKTYLYTIAKSRACTYLKREKRIFFLPKEQEETADLEEQIEEKIIQKEEASQVRNIITKLKKDYQIVLYLADIEEHSYQEISKILNKNLSQVKVLIHRARKALKKKIREEEKKNER